MRVFVTGATGFAGGHLVEALACGGHQVFAGARKNSADFHDTVKVYPFDLLSTEEVRGVLEDVRPEGIIHLAAQSNVQRAWENPAETMEVNVLGTVHLLNAARRVVPAARVIVAGSGDEYGLTAKAEETLNEEHPCLPQNPYAVSKLAAGQVALQLARRDSLQVIHARPFNHFGPGQKEGFVVSDFASQVARIEAGLLPPVIRVGDLDVERDFTDVRDVVRAYILLLESNLTSGIYNICSGVPRLVRGILQTLVNQCAVPVEIEVHPERFRPVEVFRFTGSPRKLEQATGWKPRRAFEQSLLDTLEWWRNVVQEALA